MSVNVGNVYYYKNMYVIVAGYAKDTIEPGRNYPIYLYDIVRCGFLNPYYFKNKDTVVRSLIRKTAALRYTCLLVENEDFMQGPKRSAWRTLLATELLGAGKYIRRLNKKDLNMLMIKLSMLIGSPGILSFEELCDYTKNFIDEQMQKSKKEYTDLYWKQHCYTIKGIKSLNSVSGFHIIVKTRNRFEVWQVKQSFAEDNTVFAYYKRSFKKSEFYEMLWYCEKNHKHDVYKNGAVLQLKPLEYFKGRSYICH